MIKFCPKCRRFYDDESLAFCQTDGFPLVEINQTSELWTEGAKATEKTRKILRKRAQVQKLKKFAKILVASLMTLTVISVAVMNVYIYLPTNETEKAENQTPLPNPAPTFETKIIKETPSPEESPTAPFTPSPTATPDNTPTASPTPTATKTPTPSPTATIKIEKTPSPICNNDIRLRETAAIKNAYGSSFQSRIEEERSAVIARYRNENPNYSQLKVAAELTILWEKFDVVFASDCNTSIVSVGYFWTIVPQSPPREVRVAPKEYPAGQRKFTCKKNGSWKC